MAEQVLFNIHRFDPKSWSDLADTCKLLHEEYRSLSANAARLVILTLEGSGGEFSKIPLYSLQCGLYADMSKEVRAIYFGARSAVIEATPGSFKDVAQVTMRVAEALNKGALIENFVDASLHGVAANALIQDKSNKDLVKMQDVTAEMLFDRAQRIKAQYTAAKKDISMRPQTIVQIVKEEIGVLPESFKHAIVTAMEFKPAP